MFNVRRSVRYHRRREQFLDRCSDWMKVLTAVAGSAAAMALLAESPWSQYVAFMVAILAASNLVFAPGRHAREHALLAVEFIRLEADLVRAEADLTDAKIRELTARKLTLEEGEPPHFRVLNAICFTETAKALGCSPDQYIDVPWYKRAFANLVDVFPGELEKRIDALSRSAHHTR